MNLWERLMLHITPTWLFWQVKLLSDLVADLKKQTQTLTDLVTARTEDVRRYDAMCDIVLHAPCTCNPAQRFGPDEECLRCQLDVFVG